MGTGNVTKAASIKSFLHQSYKNTNLFSFVTVLFNNFHGTSINRLFLGVTQRQELRVFFNIVTKKSLFTFNNKRYKHVHDELWDLHWV